MEAMRGFSDQELAEVQDFTLIRDGYGSIEWPGYTDVRDLDLNLIVSIENKAAEVYGPRWVESGNTEPPPGTGLNKHAIVTLLNCK